MLHSLLTATCVDLAEAKKHTSQPILRPFKSVLLHVASYFSTFPYNLCFEELNLRYKTKQN
jgi:hypothetical protein